jgi:tRNA dimethylallyltransferase
MPAPLDERLPPAVLLMGPTATGKTEAALALADRLPVGIVSVDSALVYRGMDVGTAKPDRALLARYPHALVDILDPAEPYSAARFRADALREMQAIAARGRVPLLVGGTMLYFKALTEGLSQLPAADPAIRAELERRLAREGTRALHAELAAVDPDAAARIHPNDPQRIGRALEVWRATGRPLSALQRRAEQQPAPWRFLAFALLPATRGPLHARIAARFARMMERGFLDEVRGLRARGDLTRDHPSMRAVGYRQLWQHLDGACDLAEAVARGTHATRQLAKRQHTWLRSWGSLRCFDPDAGDPRDALVAAVGEALTG